jgi:fatty-acyl-CoA synthase
VIKPVTDEEAANMTEDDVKEVAFDGQEVGEIVMRGNIVMRGYYKDPAATDKAFVAGYFRTGDLAVRYPDGKISIQDRSKDLIISGGENVSSLAVENEISTHPGSLLRWLDTSPDDFGRRS